MMKLESVAIKRFSFHRHYRSKMKYWKQFWGGLNQGWKWAHYLLFGLIVVFLWQVISALAGTESRYSHPSLSVIHAVWITALALFCYWLLISTIFEIKGGVQSKLESTKLNLAREEIPRKIKTAAILVKFL